MKWVQLVLLALKIISAIIDRIERQKIINETQREMIRKATEDVNARLAKAGNAGDDARKRFDTGGVSDVEVGFRD